MSCKKEKILIEASGSLTAGYIVKAIKSSGNIVVASDIEIDCYAKSIADDFILMPLIDDPFLFDYIEQELIHKKITCVIPSLDETLLAWSERKEFFCERGINVFISESLTIEIFQDKWKTYNFFDKHGIPTPETSLDQKFCLIKPRHGRGSAGVHITRKKENMNGKISQEYIEGTEYTVDIFCNREGIPIYIVPRKRNKVKEGKSLDGIVVYHEKIIEYIKKICSVIKFEGPINAQCIEKENGDIFFLEINPRVAGGMALGFAATENWINLMVNHFIKGKEINPVDIKYGLKMKRYYDEIFTFE